MTYPSSFVLSAQSIATCAKRFPLLLMKTSTTPVSTLQQSVTLVMKPKVPSKLMQQMSKVVRMKSGLRKQTLVNLSAPKSQPQFLQSSQKKQTGSKSQRNTPWFRSGVKRKTTTLTSATISLESTSLFSCSHIPKASK